MTRICILCYGCHPSPYILGVGPLPQWLFGGKGYHMVPKEGTGVVTYAAHGLGPRALKQPSMAERQLAGDVLGDILHGA